MKLGLKLWSRNVDYYLEAAKPLFEKGAFSFIELYTLPNTFQHISKWLSLKKDYNIPFALHLPHFAHGFNLSLQEAEDRNRQIIEESKEYISALKPIYTVLHPGIGGAVEETARQLNLLVDFDYLVENKPAIVALEGLEGKLCVGSRYDELKYLLNYTNAGLCLDIGHAICAANYYGLDIYETLKAFESLCPSAYHISDNDSTSEYDSHRHFGKGNYDFNKISSIISLKLPIAIETEKDSKENLNDFEADSIYLRRVFGGGNA